MNEMIMLHEFKARDILRTVFEKKIPVNMSYLSSGKWHLARLLLIDVRADSFDVKITPVKKGSSVDVKATQSVGISMKCGYGRGYDRFVFDAMVLNVGTLPDSMSTPALTLAIPEDIDVMQRRSYLRVNVPESMKVQVEFWHRDYDGSNGWILPGICDNWRGELVDISAGGMRIVIDAQQKDHFEAGQLLGLRFTPMPDQTPLTFNAHIRNILPTADDENICIGVQMIGLEASPEGRLVLQRLCNIVDQYHQMDRPDSTL